MREFFLAITKYTKAIVKKVIYQNQTTINI